MPFQGMTNPASCNKRSYASNAVVSWSCCNDSQVGSDQPSHLTSKRHPRPQQYPIDRIFAIRIDCNGRRIFRSVENHTKLIVNSQLRRQWILCRLFHQTHMKYMMYSWWCIKLNSMCTNTSKHSIRKGNPIKFLNWPHSLDMLQLQPHTRSPRRNSSPTKHRVLE